MGMCHIARLLPVEYQLLYIDHRQHAQNKQTQCQVHQLKFLLFVYLFPDLTVYAGLRRSRELHSGGEHLNVVAYTDNSVSAACVNSGTSKSAELLPLVKEMGLYMYICARARV